MRSLAEIDDVVLERYRLWVGQTEAVLSPSMASLRRGFSVMTVLTAAIAFVLLFLGPARWAVLVAAVSLFPLACLFVARRPPRASAKVGS